MSVSRQLRIWFGFLPGESTLIQNEFPMASKWESSWELWRNGDSTWQQSPEASSGDCLELLIRCSMLMLLEQRVFFITAPQYIRQQIEDLFAGQFVQHAFGHDADVARGAFFDVGFEDHGDLVRGGGVVDEFEFRVAFLHDEAGEDFAGRQ